MQYIYTKVNIKSWNCKKKTCFIIDIYRSMSPVMWFFFSPIGILKFMAVQNKNLNPCAWTEIINELHVLRASYSKVMNFLIFHHFRDKLSWKVPTTAKFKYLNLFILHSIQCNHYLCWWAISPEGSSLVLRHWHDFIRYICFFRLNHVNYFSSLRHTGP